MIVSPEVSLLCLIGFAFALELMFGYPQWLDHKISHPIAWLGKLISAIERQTNLQLNQEHHSPSVAFLLGASATIFVISIAGSVGIGLQLIANDSTMSTILVSVLVTPMFATRSLWIHVNAVHSMLIDHPDNLEPARYQLSKIVSRKTSELNKQDIASSAIESLAENTSDAVVAPIFWCILFGLPGLFVYKAINTLDSMWGYKNHQYFWFGKFAARLDDAANWVPSRLTALTFLLIGRQSSKLGKLKSQASIHASPNAGWPEAAMAFVLGIKLGGNFDYGEAKTAHAILNPSGRAANEVDISRALRCYVHSVSITIASAILFTALTMTAFSVSDWITS